MAEYKKPVKKAEADALMALALPMIAEGKTVKLTVTGFSMYPLVSSRRDAVLLGKAETLKVGDVPLFKREDGSFILHRIVKEKNGAYATMGDYETTEEYPVLPEQIVAKATGFYRKERFIDCRSFSYRLYSLFWRKTVFARPLMLKCMARLSDMKNKRK